MFNQEAGRLNALQSGGDMQGSFLETVCRIEPRSAAQKDGEDVRIASVNGDVNRQITYNLVFRGIERRVVCLDQCPNRLHIASFYSIVNFAGPGSD